MDSTKHLYVMISRTNTNIGRAIRVFSRYSYNHVSLTLDPTFRSWVSFARSVHNTPLYGGFTRESAERYLADTNPDDVKVRIFRIGITEEKYKKLSRLFAIADNPQSGMVYNTFDVVAAAVGLSTPICDAYTCLGFAREILQKDYPTIKALDRDLEEYLIFDGRLSDLVCDSGDRSDRFFTALSFADGTKNTLNQFLTLTFRAIHLKKSYVSSSYLG